MTMKPGLSQPSLRAILLVTAMALSGTASQAQQPFLPQTCHFNGRPEPCNANAYGLKQDPANDVEIRWADGSLTTIRYQSQGPAQVGEPVLVDGVQGRIYRVRSCAGAGQPSYLCTQITVLKPPGTLYSYSFGD